MSATEECIDAVEYKNGQKNHWRRTVWNRIDKWCPDKTLPIIYLPGSENLDSVEAMRRGWKDFNLIAVERDRNVVRYLREKAVNVIHGDMTSVALNWPSEKKIGVVVADFQSCICRDLIILVSWWLQSKALEKSVLALNIQRGREKNDIMSPVREFSDYWDTEYFRKTMGISEKHRGLHLLIGSMYATFGVLNEQSGTIRNANESISNYVLNTGMEWFFPPSYRSNKVVMDSIVVYRRKPAGIRDSPKNILDFNVRRRISAALAIRTARTNGG